MREALTVIGFLIIVAFSALLAAPLFVDWNDWRSAIAQQMANAIGATVLIEGPIDARVLPQPWLSVGKLTIGEPGGATTLVIEQAEADIALGALISGSFVLSNVTLEQPRLTIKAEPGGKIAPLILTEGDRPVVVENFQIGNGSVSYVDPRLGSLTVDEIGLVGDARSLAGPMKAEGGVMIDGRRQSVTLSVGNVDSEGARVKLAILPVDNPVTIDLDGKLNADDKGPRFDGTATIARAEPVGRGDKATDEERPWRLTASLAVTPDQALAETLEIQIGSSEAGVKLTGAGSYAFGEKHRATAELRATQIEFDRLAGVNPNERLAPMSVLARLRDSLPEIILPDVPMAVSLKADGAILGGLALAGLSTDLASTSTGWRITDLSAALPGRTRLIFDGDVTGNGDSALSGRIDVDARQASSLLAWLEGVNRPAAPNAAQRLNLTGAVLVGNETFSVRDLKLAIDDATATGSISVGPASQGRAGRRLVADLVANRFDVDTLPSIAALAPGGGAIAEADLKMRASEIVYGGIAAKSAAGRVVYEGDGLTISNLAIDDFGGASIIANGSVRDLSKAPTGAITIGIDASDLSPVATALAKSSVPPGLLAGFQARAAALSPAKAIVDLAFGAQPSLGLDGRFGGTQVSSRIELNKDGGDDKIDATLSMQGLDAVRLLQQIGLSPLPLTVAGEAKLTLAVDGPLNSARNWSASLMAAGLRLDGSGKLVGPIDRVPAFDGRVTAKVADVPALAQLFGVTLAGVLPGESAQIESGLRVKDGAVALDDLTGVLLGTPVTGAFTVQPGFPAAIGGRLALQSFDLDRLVSLASGTDLTAPGPSGGLPEEQFAQPPGVFAVGKVAVTLERLGLGTTLPAATAVRGVVTLQPSGTTFEQVVATLAGGSVAGDAVLARGAAETALKGRVSVSGAQVATRVLDGKLDAALEFQGSGRTPSALLGALTGGGTLSLQDGRLHQLAVDAFPKTVAALDAAPSTAPFDLGSTLRTELDAGSLPVGSVSGSLALANGVLRLGSTAAPQSPVALRLAAQTDLASFASRVDLAVKPDALPDGFGGQPPEFSLRIKATPLDIERSLELEGLSAWSTIRSAEREQKKLEALEAERQAREAAAAEVKRLEAERMRQLIEARRKAEEEKKAAEAAKKAAEDAKKAEAAAKKAAEEARKAEEAAKKKQGATDPAVQQPAPVEAPPAVPAAPVDVAPLPLDGTALPPSATGGAELEPEPLPFPDPVSAGAAAAPQLPPPIDVRRAPGVAGSGSP